MLRAIQILLISGILNAHYMSGQPSIPPEPMAVVRTAFQAYGAGHWREFTALVHPDALTGFRTQYLEMGEVWEAHAAEINEVRQRAETNPDLRNPVLSEFTGVKTLAELRELSPQEFLARYLEARSPKANPRDPDYQPPVSTREIIGQVAESPDLAHVVYRVHTDVGRYGRTESVEVVSVKRAPTGWRLMLNNELSFTGYVSVTVNPSSQD